MDTEAFKKYLATGEHTPTMDSAETDLEKHDRRFHPKGYKEGDYCAVREALSKGDNSDIALAEAERRESWSDPRFTVEAILNDMTTERANSLSASQKRKEAQWLSKTINDILASPVNDTSGSNYIHATRASEDFLGPDHPLTKEFKQRQVYYERLWDLFARYRKECHRNGKENLWIRGWYEKNREKLGIDDVVPQISASESKWIPEVGEQVEVYVSREGWLPGEVLNKDPNGDGWLVSVNGRSLAISHTKPGRWGNVRPVQS